MLPTIGAHVNNNQNKDGYDGFILIENIGAFEKLDKSAIEKSISGVLT